MKTRRLFITLVIVFIFLVGSIYVARKKRLEVVLPVNTNAPTVSPDIATSPTDSAMSNSAAGGADGKVVVEDPPQEIPTPVVSSPAPESTPGSCVPQKEYLEIRKELGVMVNKHDLSGHDIQEFVQILNEFRLKMGLPLPLQVTSGKLEEQGVVYNNCRPTCKGMVNQVFVSKVIEGRYVEVLMKDGTHQKLPLHESGIEVATVDEINARGVPFRSWLTPVSGGDWYVLGGDLYYGLDIEGMWLKIDGKNNWDVVSKPVGLIRLTAIEPAEKIIGCHADEVCLGTPAAAGTVRHFRAPKSCAPVLSHATDELSNRDENGNLPRPPSAGTKTDRDPSLPLPPTQD